MPHLSGIALSSIQSSVVIKNPRGNHPRHSSRVLNGRFVYINDKSEHTLHTYVEANPEYRRYGSINYRQDRKVDSGAVYGFGLQALQFSHRLYLDGDPEHASTRSSSRSPEGSNT